MHGYAPEYHVPVMDLTYGQAKQKMYLCLLEGNELDAIKWLHVMGLNAESDQQYEDIDQIMAAIMSEDGDTLQECFE